MDGFILILFLIIAVVLAIGIPVGISFLTYRFIEKRNYDKRLRLIALIPILTLAYFIYTAIYPNNDFYKDDFKEVTGIEFPASGKIIYKTASYPDQFGDYGSASLIKVDKDFYEKLKTQIKAKGLTKTSERNDSYELDQALGKIGDKKIEEEYSSEEGGGVYYYVAFLSDNETLVINRQSW